MIKKDDDVYLGCLRTAESNYARTQKRFHRLVKRKASCAQFSTLWLHLLRLTEIFKAYPPVLYPNIFEKFAVLTDAVGRKAYEVVHENSRSTRPHWADDAVMFPDLVRPGASEAEVRKWDNEYRNALAAAGLHAAGKALALMRALQAQGIEPPKGVVRENLAGISGAIRGVRCAPGDYPKGLESKFQRLADEFLEML